MLKGNCKMMKSKSISWSVVLVAAAVALANISVASAYDYPSCLMQRVPGAHTTKIIVSDSLSRHDAQSCMQEHLRSHLSEIEQSNVSFVDAPKDVAVNIIENWQANFALLDVESGSQGAYNLLGVAVALGGDTMMEKLEELRYGDDWSEVARLSAMIGEDQSIMGHLKGNMKYWQVLGQLSPSALTDHSGRVIPDRMAQHFHLIRIRCLDN